MPLPGVCTECGKPLEGRSKFTCGTSCRAKRSRRLRRQKIQAGQSNGYGTELAPLNKAIDRAGGDVAHEVMKEELRPVVREALTEETLRAIDRMIALTPRAVQCIAEDLESIDSVIRQRAYTLLMKYTVGHQAIVRPEDEGAQGGMVVHFNLPRPGDDVQSDGAATALITEEIRTCDLCGQDKPITEFVAGSHRCATCYDEQRAYAQRLLDGNGSQV